MICSGGNSVNRRRPHTTQPMLFHSSRCVGVVIAYRARFPRQHGTVEDAERILRGESGRQSASAHSARLTAGARANARSASTCSATAVIGSPIAREIGSVWLVVERVPDFGRCHDGVDQLPLSKRRRSSTTATGERRPTATAGRRCESSRHRRATGRNHLAGGCANVERRDSRILWRG